MTTADRVNKRSLASELQKAARNGNVRLVRKLLAKGAPPDAQDVDGWTCLHAAAVEGHVAVVRELCGEDVGAMCPGEEGDDTCSATSHCSDADLPIGNVGEELLDVNITTACGRTALYFAALDGKAECVSVLLRHGADPLCRCKEGKSPLDVAILFERADVRALLQSAIDCPRPPITRRPKRSAKVPANTDKDVASQQGQGAPNYIPPAPSEWRKSDFAKWGKITDRDLDALDAHMQRTEEQAAKQREATRLQTGKNDRPATATPSVREDKTAQAKDEARKEPPFPPPPSPEESMHESTGARSRKTGSSRGEEGDAGSDRLFSLRPPPEGGAEPDKNNGSHGIGYTWGQTPSEVHVWIVLTQGTCKEDISCIMAPTSLSVSVRRGGAAGRRDTIFKDAWLWRRIKVGDSRTLFTHTHTWMTHTHTSRTYIHTRITLSQTTHIHITYTHIPGSLTHTHIHTYEVDDTYIHITYTHIPG
jgi:ankyrin repeat protein